MNIFVLDTDPVLAAQYQCDVHVVKLLLETGQILCTAIILHGGQAPYRPTHIHHPCTKWAAASKANFNWLRTHGLALAAEYTFRYGKIHKTQAIIERASDAVLPDGSLTGFAQAMPEQYRREDPVAAYRAYYRGEKANMARWTKRATPYWW